MGIVRESWIFSLSLSLSLQQLRAPKRSQLRPVVVNMSDSDNAKICRVGYALNAKKLRRAASVATAGEQPAPQQQQSSRLGSPWRGGGLADILELEPSAGELVQFIPWDHETPLECQPEFHVIIHKLTEDIDRVESSSKLQALEQYISQHPSTVIVDPIASVRKVVSRARTCFHLQSIENRLGNQCPFHQPNFLLVGQCSDDELLAEVRAKNMSFPLICKPIEACGTPHSHQMVSIRAHSSLSPSAHTLARLFLPTLTVSCRAWTVPRRWWFSLRRM